MTAIVRGVQTTVVDAATDIITNHDAFVFDMDGVLWKGREAIPGAVDAIKYLREDMKKLVFFATNNSSSTRSQFREKLRDLGFGDFEEDAFYCTSWLAATVLQNLGIGGKVLVFGSEALACSVSEVRGVIPVTLANKHIAQADFDVDVDTDIKAVVCGFDAHTSYYRLAYAASLLREVPNCKFIITNEDVNFPTPKHKLPGAGSLLKSLIAASDRMPIVCGKPNTLIAEHIIAKHSLPAGRVCMVGDNLLTDIEFGQRANFDCALVETGMHTREDIKGLLNPYSSDTLSSTQEVYQSSKLDQDDKCTSKLPDTYLTKDSKVIHACDIELDDEDREPILANLANTSYRHIPTGSPSKNLSAFPPISKTPLSKAPSESCESSSRVNKMSSTTAVCAAGGVTTTQSVQQQLREARRSTGNVRVTSSSEHQAMGNASTMMQQESKRADAGPAPAMSVCAATDVQTLERVRERRRMEREEIRIRRREAREQSLESTLRLREEEEEKRREVRAEIAARILELKAEEEGVRERLRRERQLFKEKQRRERDESQERRLKLENELIAVEERLNVEREKQREYDRCEKEEYKEIRRREKDELKELEKRYREESIQRRLRAREEREELEEKLRREREELRAKFEYLERRAEERIKQERGELEKVQRRRRSESQERHEVAKKTSEESIKNLESELEKIEERLKTEEENVKAYLRKEKETLQARLDAELRQFQERTRHEYDRLAEQRRVAREQSQERRRKFRQISQERKETLRREREQVRQVHRAERDASQVTLKNIQAQTAKQNQLRNIQSQRDAIAAAATTAAQQALSCYESQRQTSLERASKFCSEADDRRRQIVSRNYQ